MWTCPGGTGGLQCGHNFRGDSAIMPKPWWQRPIDGDPIRIGYSEPALRVLSKLDHPQNPHYRAIREAIWSLENGAPERVKRVRADIPIFQFGVGDFTLVFVPHEEMRLIEVYRLTKRTKRPTSSVAP